MVLLSINLKIIFTVRISGTTFRPEVPHPGRYVMKAGPNSGEMRVVGEVSTTGRDEILEVAF